MKSNIFTSMIENKDEIKPGFTKKIAITDKITATMVWHENDSSLNVYFKDNEFNSFHLRCFSSWYLGEDLKGTPEFNASYNMGNSNSLASRSFTSSEQYEELIKDHQEQISLLNHALDFLDFVNQIKEHMLKVYISEVVNPILKADEERALRKAKIA